MLISNCVTMTKLMRNFIWRFTVRKGEDPHSSVTLMVVN